MVITNGIVTFGKHPQAHWEKFRLLCCQFFFVFLLPKKQASEREREKEREKILNKINNIIYSLKNRKNERKWKIIDDIKIKNKHYVLCIRERDLCFT